MNNNEYLTLVILWQAHEWKGNGFIIWRGHVTPLMVMYECTFDFMSGSGGNVSTLSFITIRVALFALNHNHDYWQRVN